MIQIIKAHTIAFMKSRNSLFVPSRENKKKKTEDGENIFSKALANRFWLTSKNCLWFNKVFHGRPSIKWTSWRGNDMLLKAD